jgi:DNA-binding CsgD family transcriptional regulator
VSGDGGLLERGRELAALAEVIEVARRGCGRAALLDGPAGIGKTALLAVARARATDAGMTVLTARGGELESEFPWGVVRQLFAMAVTSASARDSSDLLDGAAALARPALGIEAIAATVDASYATLHGLYWLTVNLAQQVPLLLLVDDAHWADAPSLRFLAHLASRIGELPVLLLMASRPVGSEPGSATELVRHLVLEPGVTVLHPEPLSEAASSALVRDALSGDASRDLCAACHEVTGGNPFLLRSLVDDLLNDDESPRQVSAAQVRRMTPAVVSASVLLRLARLTTGAVALARAVAILGARCDLRRARLLAGLDPDEGTVAASALIRAGILSEDTTLAFVHPLVAAAVLGDLSGPERSRWHRKAAHLLADEHANVEQVAAHLVESTAEGDPWTVQQLRDGAAHAWEEGAPEIAIDYLRRALAEPPDSETRVEVLVELGRAEAVTNPVDAVPHLRAAFDGARPGLRRAALALALGDALLLSGQFSESVRVVDVGLADLGDDDADLRASLEATRLGAARWDPNAQDRRDELVDDLERRLRNGEALDARLHASLAMEAAARGTDRDGAIDHARRALAALERSAAIGAGTVPEPILTLAFADLPDEGALAADEWIATAERAAWPLGAALCSAAAALAALHRGTIGDAVAHARRAVTPGMDVFPAPVNVAWLVEALVEHGELDVAFDELAGRGFMGELPFMWAMASVFQARGRLHAAAGDHEAAVRDLLATGEMCAAWDVTNPAMMAWRSSAAVSLVCLGERARALDLAEEELALAHRWDTPRAIGVALRAVGVARDGDAGVDSLRAAVDALQTSHAPLELARAHTDLGAMLRRLGQRSEACEQLRAGLDLAHRLGGIAVAERAREELTIAGARPRRNARRGRDALTPSELRIVQLAVEGRTNREIAESLFLTLRTVETHLTNAYAKLGITSRRELASALDAS